MEDTYKFEVECVENYYGYPQAKQKFKVRNAFCYFLIIYYGNQGVDIPVDISQERKYNGYFWNSHALMRFIYKESNNFMSVMRSMRENEKKYIVINSKGELQ